MIRQIRGNDKWGSGAYLASRDGGRRKHNGIDFITTPEELIGSYCNGTVTKIGYPYDPNKEPSKAHYRYVQVTTSDNLNVRIFYIEPLVKLYDVIDIETVIGKSQCLQSPYPLITQHIHFEIKNLVGEFLSPEKYLNYRHVVLGGI